MEPGTSVELAGPWRATVADEALRRAYPDEGFDDGGWSELAVPSHWRSSPGFSATDGPLLYRTRFETPDVAAIGDARTWLTLDGVFYTSDVWLDGAYLGDTEGYFFSHSFEVSDAVAAQREHTLAMEVSCRPETDRAAKRNLTGVFQHWDLLDQDWNPGGIWRPVRLEQSGPVRIKFFRALCRDANESQATVFVRAVLDTVNACNVELVSTVAPANAGNGGEGIEHRFTQPLAAGENRVEWTITVTDPELWWPHTLGSQPLYDLAVDVRLDDGADGAVSDRRERRLGLRSVAMHNWVFSINGERLFLKGSNQGPTKMALAEASDADLAADVHLAKQANLDFLRVHAHVSRAPLYDAADEAGVLVWQDMPLQWGYHRSIRKQARRQARELVDLLAHHPSLFVWCGHNEPMAIDVEPVKITDPVARAKLVSRAVVGQVLPAWNKSVLDFSIKKVIEKTDGSRPVIPHSGIFPHPPQLDGTDTHTYFGWYYGHARDFVTAMRQWPRLARFVTEFGAQAVPDDASFLEPERWPDLDWDRAYRTHALQKVFMDNYVPAADYATFDEWVRATQEYQAEVIKLHVETLRRIKYRPCGGFAQFCFGDGYPSVTWSVLDDRRRPKLGYGALTDACRPVVVVADALPAEVRPGEALALDIHVVSDRHIDLSDMLVHAHLSWGEGASGPQSGEHDWRWRGDVPADSCIRIGTLQAVVPTATGSLVLDLSLSGADLDGDKPVDNRYTARIVG